MSTVNPFATANGDARTPREARTVTFVSQLPVSLEQALEVMIPSSEHNAALAARDGSGVYLCPPFDVGGHVTGRLALIMATPREFAANPQRALAGVLEAAKEADPEWVGLGSYTVRPTADGVAVVRALQGTRTVTHGDAGSVAAILRCLELADVRPGTRTAVVGAYGLIGTALSWLLAHDGWPLVLIGRSRSKLERLAAELPGTHEISAEVTSVAGCEAVITVTSASQALVAPDMLDPGTVVVDPAIPPNVAPDPGWSQRGLRVVTNASQLLVPGVDVDPAQWGLDRVDGIPTAYGCIAETLAKALTGDRDNWVGRIELEWVRKSQRMFANLGWTHAPLRSFDLPLPLSHVPVRSRERSGPRCGPLSPADLSQRTRQPPDPLV